MRCFLMAKLLFVLSLSSFLKKAGYITALMSMTDTFSSRTTVHILMLQPWKFPLAWPENLKLKFNGVKMKINLSTTTLWTLVGVQIIVFICLYALLWRVGELESNSETKTERYVFEREDWILRGVWVYPMWLWLGYDGITKVSNRSWWQETQ